MKTKTIEAYDILKAKLIEQELPTVGENDVLLKCLYSTISPGTELAWIKQLPGVPVKFPFCMGYSSSCKVIEVGNKVTSVVVGDTVIARTLHSAYTVMPANQITKISCKVDPIEASAFRLASISLQGVRKADIQIGDDVAVIGLGAIGNYATQLSYVAGAGSVTGFDFVDWRRDLAKECGIQNVEKDTTPFEEKFDVVFEATGVPAVVNAALSLVKPLGTVVLLGSTRGLTDSVDFYKNVHRKGCVIVGAHEMHRSRDVRDRFGHFRSNIEDEATIGKLLEAKRITLRPLISSIASPEEAESIYKRLDSKKENLVLISYDWSNY